MRLQTGNGGGSQLLHNSRSVASATLHAAMCSGERQQRLAVGHSKHTNKHQPRQSPLRLLASSCTCQKCNNERLPKFDARIIRGDGCNQ